MFARFGHRTHGLTRIALAIGILAALSQFNAPEQSQKPKGPGMFVTDNALLNRCTGLQKSTSFGRKSCVAMEAPKLSESSVQFLSADRN